MAKCNHGLKVGDNAKVVKLAGPMAGFKIGDIVNIQSDGHAGCCDLCIAKHNSRLLGYCDYEHLAPIETKPKLKVGDLAKVVDASGQHTAKRGDIVKITDSEAYNPYANRLSDGKRVCIKRRGLDLYTPAPGDELTVDGVKYRLEARKAMVGEKVLVVNAFGGDGEYYSDGDVIAVEEDEEGYAVLNGLYASQSEYLVLAPATSRGDHTHAIRWIDGGEDDGTKITLTLRDGFRTIETSVESGDEHTELSIDDYTLIIPHHIVKSVKVGE